MDFTTMKHFQESNNVAGLAAEAFEVFNIDASILEAPYGSNTTCLTQFIRRGSEIIGNYLIDLIKNYTI